MAYTYRLYLLAIEMYIEAILCRNRQPCWLWRYPLRIVRYDELEVFKTRYYYVALLQLCHIFLYITLYLNKALRLINKI